MRLARFAPIFAASLIPCLAHAVPAHYIVLHEDATGAVRVVSTKVVDVAAIPKLAKTTQWNGHGSRAERRLSVRALKDGRTVFETDAVTSAELRGEFAGKENKMDSFRQPLAERDYVVRLPVISGAHALVSTPAADTAKKSSPGAGALLDIDLDALSRASVATVTKAASADLTPLVATGSPANRLDILIIGDGYTADQRAKFQQDAQDTAARFLSISPYADYRPLINVNALFVASNQSGASKPSCAETPGSPVVSVDTALKATFCTSGIRRMVTVDNSLTYAAASAAPDWDTILVIVNDSEYGGSGGSFSVVSTNSSSVLVAQHEFGHTFTRLADEYPDAYPGYPPCTDAGAASNPCEPNVTDILGPVKWAGWMDAATAVPSTQVPQDPRAAGAWEGARYQAGGMYRQCYNGIMRTLGMGFCKVDSAAFVDRLYGRGWGAPADGVSNIEPGAFPDSPSISAAAGTRLSFGAHVAGPAQGVRATWSIDGAVVSDVQLASGAATAYDLTVASGTHAVTLVVTDLATYLRGSRSSTRTWTVTGSAPPNYALTISKAGPGSGLVTSSPSGISCGTTCTARYVAGTAVTITATTDKGSRFAGWSGACAGTGPCSFTVDATTSVTANFEVLQPGAVLAKPNSVGFGAQSLQTTSPAQSVTLTNVGQQSLDITSISATPGFAATHDCGTLQPGGECAAWVSFTPTSTGTVSGTLTISSSVGTYTVSLSGLGERSLVTHFYQSILRRAPDSGGKAFWESEAARMQSLGANVNETWFAMSAAFFSSNEYAALNRDDAGFVEDLYQTFFNRAADASGADYWRGQLAGGLPRAAALAAFTFSQEFGAYTHAVFTQNTVRAEMDVVTDFYRGVLGRLPDDDGFHYWVAQFHAASCSGAAAVNATADTISAQFTESGEYSARRHDDRQFVGDLYNAFLRRGGDLSGVRYWVDQLSSHGMTRDSVRKAFLGSDEFRQRVSAIAAGGCNP